VQIVDGRRRREVNGTVKSRKDLALRRQIKSSIPACNSKYQ